VPKAKTKTKPKKSNNVVKLEEVKETKKKETPKSKNITLDKKPDGNYICTLDHYRKDYERWFTIDDVLLLIPDNLKKRTWSLWRSMNNEPGVKNGDKLGPQYVIFGRKVYKIKFIWILRYIKGHKWEPELQVQSSAMQSDEMLLRSSSSI